MAYMTITLEYEKSKDQGTMSEILAQKEELAGLNMPEESKAMMEAMLDGALAMLQTVEATSSADKAAVKPYFNEIGEILGDEDETNCDCERRASSSSWKFRLYAAGVSPVHCLKARSKPRRSENPRSIANC